MEDNNKKSIFIVIIGILIAVARMYFDVSKNNVDQQYILVFMAVVNLAAGGIVVLFLFNGMKSKCIQYVNDYKGIETERKRKVKQYFGIAYWILLLIIFVLGIGYVCKWKTSTGNDMISIIALAVSIANDGIIEEHYIWISRKLIKMTARKIRIGEKS